MWAVSGKVADTQWFKSLVEAEAFAGFKFKEFVSKLTALRAERDELRIALESLLPLAVHTSPDDVAVHAARAVLAEKEAK